MGEEERIRPQLVKKLYEVGHYQTFNTRQETCLKEILHSIIGNVVIPVNWVAKKPEECKKRYPEIFSMVQRVMPNTTSEAKYAKVSQWQWVDESTFLTSDNFPPSKSQFIDTLLDLYQLFAEPDEKSKFNRHHLREVATTLELGLDKQFDAIDKKLRERKLEGLKKTGEQGYSEMERDPPKRESP